MNTSAPACDPVLPLFSTVEWRPAGCRWLRWHIWFWFYYSSHDFVVVEGAVFVVDVADRNVAGGQGHGLARSGFVGGRDVTASSLGGASVVAPTPPGLEHVGDSPEGRTYSTIVSLKRN